MEIVWDYEALDDLEVILCYIETQFLMKEARLFRQQVVHVIRNLCEFPFLGKVEPLLEDFEEMELRSIPVDSNKLTILFLDGEDGITLYSC